MTTVANQEFTWLATVVGKCPLLIRGLKFHHRRKRPINAFLCILYLKSKYSANMDWKQHPRRITQRFSAWTRSSALESRVGLIHRILVHYNHLSLLISTDSLSTTVESILFHVKQFKNCFPVWGGKHRSTITSALN